MQDEIKLIPSVTDRMKAHATKRKADSLQPAPILVPIPPLTAVSSAADLSGGVEELTVPVHVIDSTSMPGGTFTYIERSLNRSHLTTEGAMISELLDRSAVGGRLTRELISANLARHHGEDTTLFRIRQQKCAGTWMHPVGSGGGGGDAVDGGGAGADAGDGGGHMSFGCGKCRWAPKGCGRCRVPGVRVLTPDRLGSWSSWILIACDPDRLRSWSPAILIACEPDRLRS